MFCCSIRAMRRQGSGSGAPRHVASIIPVNQNPKHCLSARQVNNERGKAGGEKEREREGERKGGSRGESLSRRKRK